MAFLAGDPLVEEEAGRRGGGALKAMAVASRITALVLALNGMAVSAGADEGTYRTPLAGEAKEVVFMGERVSLPGMDRSRMRSITLGATLLAPSQGDTSVFPVGAFYYRRYGEGFRTRDMVSVFVNELEYDLGRGTAELALQFENYTLPTEQSEVVDGVEAEGTSLYYGTLMASAGPGWRFPVHPFQVDNDLRLQLLGRAGYFFADSADESAPGIWVPTDTVLYGARLRGRYDGLRRNLLELPHQGIAAGCDVEYTYRDRWRDPDGFSVSGSRKGYWQGSAYLVGATGVPGWSERNKLVWCLYGGHTFEGRGDRFNAFRITGAPFPSEADDLARPRYSGTIYNSALTTSYATATLGYRRELTFFLYLTALGSYMNADRATVEGGDRVVFRSREGGAATVALDSAFFWDSSLYLAYAWDSGIVRNGRSGSGVTFMWNKLF